MRFERREHTLEEESLIPVAGFLFLITVVYSPFDAKFVHVYSPMNLLPYYRRVELARPGESP